MTLEVELRHRFEGFTLDVAFSSPVGITALFGRSGAGKSTVINAVAGLLRPDHGRIAAGGVVLTDTRAGVLLPSHRRRIGYVFQDARLFPHLTVLQNLLYGRWFAPKDNSVRLEQIVELLGISHLLPRRPAALSGGEKQRVAIGRAILSNPRLLLLDEPLAALDEERKGEILPYLEQMRDELNLPILYVSHSMAEVARLADTVVLMEKGRVTAAGPASAILSDPANVQGLGLRDLGSFLTATIVAQSADGLTRLDSAAGPLWLPGTIEPAGKSVRIRILAQDVMLATARPGQISALNILPARVAELRPREGPEVLVRLDLGGEMILARVLRRSAEALELAPGKPVFAIVKAISLAKDNAPNGS